MSPSDVTYRITVYDTLQMHLDKTMQGNDYKQYKLNYVSTSIGYLLSIEKSVTCTSYSLLFTMLN